MSDLNLDKLEQRYLERRCEDRWGQFYQITNDHYAEMCDDVLKLIARIRELEGEAKGD